MALPAWMDGVAEKSLSESELQAVYDELQAELVVTRLQAKVDAVLKELEEERMKLQPPVSVAMQEPQAAVHGCGEYSTYHDR